MQWQVQLDGRPPGQAAPGGKAVLSRPMACMARVARPVGVARPGGTISQTQRSTQLYLDRSGSLTLPRSLTVVIVINRRRVIIHFYYLTL